MFERLLKIITKEQLDKLSKISVLLVGVGGVGGYTLEALIRMGIKNITIIDNDIVDLTNLNRQIITNTNNIGNNKVDEAIKRAKSINPDINIKGLKLFLTKDNIKDINIKEYDYIIDACDTITTKVELIKYAKKENIKIITCLGTGNRLDPTKVVITDIYKTNYDPLAKIMRKLLKDNNIKKQDVVYSTEIPIKTSDRTPGSSSLVPSTAGIYLAYYIIKDSIL